MNVCAVHVNWIHSQASLKIFKLDWNPSISFKLLELWWMARMFEWKMNRMQPISEGLTCWKSPKAFSYWITKCNWILKFKSLIARYSGTGLDRANEPMEPTMCIVLHQNAYNNSIYIQISCATRHEQWV